MTSPPVSRHVWDCNFILITSQVKQFTLNNDTAVLNSGPFLARPKRSSEYSNGRYQVGVLWVKLLLKQPPPSEKAAEISLVYRN